MKINNLNNSDNKLIKNTKLKYGFSLIELMVVMAIVAVLLTLTGGIMQQNIAKQERVVELEQVTQLFNQLAYQSYYGKGPISVRLQENKRENVTKRIAK